MLVLDGTPQITAKDGFIYNEMITHIAMTTHGAPRRAAMIGGGDCGPSREALKYKTMQQIDVVGIEPKLVDVCRTWLTQAGTHEREACINMIYRL
jgi:spermidine synthase